MLHIDDVVVIQRSSPNNNNSNHSNHSNHSDHSNHPHSWLLRSPLADDGSLYGPLDGSSDATDADDVFGPLSNVVGTFASQAFQEAFPSSAATPLHAQSSVFNRVVPGHPAGAAAYAYLDGSSSSSSTGGAGGEDPDAPITRQGFGYAMCFLSTALYAIFEVLYKRFATHVEDPFPVANSQRFLGLIGCSVRNLHASQGGYSGRVDVSCESVELACGSALLRIVHRGDCATCADAAFKNWAMSRLLVQLAILC